MRDVPKPEERRVSRDRGSRGPGPSRSFDLDEDLHGDVLKPLNTRQRPLALDFAPLLS